MHSNLAVSDAVVVPMAAVVDDAIVVVVVSKRPVNNLSIDRNSK